MSTTTPISTSETEAEHVMQHDPCVDGIGMAESFWKFTRDHSHNFGLRHFLLEDPHHVITEKTFLLGVGMYRDGEIPRTAEHSVVGAIGDVALMSITYFDSDGTPYGTSYNAAVVELEAPRLL